MWRQSSERLAAPAPRTVPTHPDDLAFSGLWAPLVTPFRGGRVDHAALAILARRLGAGGLTGLVVGGPVGEIEALSLRERLRVAATVCQATGGALPVLAHVRDLDTVSAAREIGQFNLPVAGFVAPVPQGIGPEAAYGHFMALAEAACTAVIPLARNGASLAPEAMARLHATGRFPAVILEGRAIEALTPMVELDGPRVLCGGENWLFVTLQLGGHGGVLPLANLAPEALAHVQDLFRAGREEAAWAAFVGLRNLCAAITGPARLPALKAALALQQPMTEDLRATAPRLDAATRMRLGTELRRLRLMRDLGQAA